MYWLVADLELRPLEIALELRQKVAVASLEVPQLHYLRLLVLFR